VTLQEAIDAANGGDVMAMLNITSYYLKDVNAETMEQALPWCEKAAYKGSWQGAKYAVIIHNTYGVASMATGDWQSTIDDLYQSITFSKMIIDFNSADAETINWATSTIKDAFYKIALCYTKLKNYGNAISALSALDCSGVSKARLLKGVCTFCMAESNADFYNAYQLLSVFLEVSPELLLSNTSGVTEEIALVMGYLFLAIILRTGEGGIHIDVNKAYMVTSNVYPSVQTVEARRMLSDELAHYQKKVFGGYQYID
jgi:tetratricopeptide (TPR) repeat protein